MKRYPEAATALESAVKLNPGHDELKYRLVDAYLRSGNDAKLTEVLPTVATKDAPASGLNTLAFEFALRGKQIPLALEYATKAVKDAEEDSQNINLEDLDKKDLRRAGTLAAYWDTIGWVYAGMSEWEQAERYLDASWTLSLDGLTGAHLCHVYENEHKIQAAVRMCPLALFRFPMGKPSWMDDIPEETAKVGAALERLRPGSSKLDNMGALSDDLNRWRSFKLPHILSGTAKAEFFLLLVSDGKTPTFKVKGTKFIKGSEKLQSAGKYLMPLNFKLSAPDSVPTRVVRRGVLGCYQYSGCDFILLELGSGYSLD